ncbi:MAG: photosystem I protein PsaX [Leptolyngbyaceae cyanobacterium bins.349]|nr:photosystem I protein PsaX [Leptolyngbyaceae cyanobacterium bins.349]
MATQSQQKKPSYTFRAGWAILLLAVNFLVAAIYAHLINI